MRAYNLMVSVVIGLLGCSNQGMKPSEEETTELWKKIRVQDSAINNIQQESARQLVGQISSLTPEKALEDSFALSSLLASQDFFSDDLFSAGVPLLDEARSENEPRLLVPLLEYLDAAARLSVLVRLQAASLVGKREAMQTGLQKLMATIQKLRDGSTEGTLADVVKGSAFLIGTPAKETAFGLEDGNQGRILKITDKEYGPYGSPSSFTLVSTDGANIETRVTAPAEKVALLKGAGNYSFLLNRETNFVSEYLDSFYSIVRTEGELKRGYSKATDALESAIKSPRTSQTVFDEDDYNELRHEQVSALKSAFEQTRASMDKLTGRVLSLTEEINTSLPASLKKPLATTKLIEPTALRDYGVTFLNAKTLSLLFQYSYVTRTFVKELQEHNQKVENTSKNLEEIKKGSFTRPTYVVAVRFLQDIEHIVVEGSLCVLIGEPRTEERQGVSYRIYTLQASIDGTIFEHEEKIGEESVWHIKNPEVFPEYKAQLVSDYQARLARLKLLAAEIQNIQKQLRPALIADLSREVSF